MKKNFFITYHHSDELAARWIAAVLKEVPFSMFMESWDFLPGQKPVEKIEHMTAAARSALLLVSDRFLQAGVDAESWQAVTEKFDINAVKLHRIDSCDVEKVLGAVPYTNLFGLKEAEARKRLLIAVGSPTPDKIETERLPVTAITADEMLEKRKAELDELLKTTIKHNYHMKLDLEQEVKKEVEIKNEKTGEIEKRKQWVWEAMALETVLKDGNNYILVNPSGMGKTTFLTHTARVLLDSAGDYPFVPLFFTCIALNNRESSITSFIHQRMEGFYNNSQTALVQGEWDNLCVLLDALDQARDVDDIVSSLQLLSKSQYYKKAKIILSSRENAADKVKEGFRKIRLILPEKDEVRHYLGEENYKQLEGHIAASGELVKVPVLLEMLKTITEKGYNASKLWSRADLYTEFTRILVDQERNKPRFWQDSLAIHHFINNELEQALEKIAFFSLVENQILEIEKGKLSKYCETPEKKEALLNIGILLELFEDREQKIVFRHQSFQAYFAARYMYFRRPELFEKLTGDIGFFYNDVWYEVMRFFVGLEKDPQKVENIIELMFKQKFSEMNLADALRLIFAVFLISEARVSINKVRNLHEHLRLLLTNTRKYWNLFLSNFGKFNPGNDEQRRSLFITSVPLLRDRDWEVSRAAAEALGKIGTAEDIPLLKPLLRDEAANVRMAAAVAMGNIGTAEDIPLLKPLLRDEASNVRMTAAEALGKIGTTNDIHLLEPLLRDEDKIVRSFAAAALGNIGTVNDIPLLRRLLKDEVEYVRGIATKALRKIGSTNEISPLEPQHWNQDERARSFVAEMFGDISTANDIPSLATLFRNKNQNARRAATIMLGNIGTSEDVPLLEPLLRDEDGNVRCTAAHALGKIGTANDISLLEPLIRDGDEFVLRAAIGALGKIGTTNDIPLLEPLLKDFLNDNRTAAAKAIEQIYKRSTPVLRIDDVVAKKEVKKFVIAKTAPTQPLHILHISDIHYATEKNPFITRIFHEFIEDIKKWRSQQNNQNIHAICLTGDIAQSGQKNQYTAINQKINKILETTGCSKDNLFIIPGNHDVHEYEDISDKGKTILKQIRENKLNIDSHVLADFENYREFHEKFSHYYGFVETSGYLNSLTEKPAILILEKLFFLNSNLLGSLPLLIKMRRDFLFICH